MTSVDYDAIVVGGGHNGLVVERRPFVGGACYDEELFPGYRSPGCAHALGALYPKVVRDVELRRFGRDVISPDPTIFRPFQDRRHLLLW